MSGKRQGAALASLLLMPLLLTGCVASAPAAPTPTAASPTPEATPTPSAPPAAWPTCDELALIIDGAGLLPNPVHGNFSPAQSTPRDLSVPYPGLHTVTEAGGLACRTADEGVTVSILQDARADVEEARRAVDAVPVEAATGRQYSESPVADGGVVTCRNTGTGGLCTWSLRADDAWVVIKLSPLPLAALVFPADLPSGAAQIPFPKAGGVAESLVAELIVSLTASIPDRSGVPVGTSCVTLATPARVRAAVGTDLGAADAAPEQPVESAVATTSTAGYALPAYAARDAGWSRCVLGDYGGELIVVTRPLGDVKPDPARATCNRADGPEEFCRAAVIVGSELRVAQFGGPAGTTSVAALEALLR